MPYTPWMKQAGQTIGGVIQHRGMERQKEYQKKLAGDAYMGDPEAMQELMQVNPQMGAQIQQQAQQRKAKDQQAQLQKRTQFNKDLESTMANIAKFDSYEEAREFGESRLGDLAQRYPEVMRAIGEDAIFDEDDFKEAKTIFGAGAKGAEDFTLAKDAVRFSAGGKEIARGIESKPGKGEADGEGAFAGTGMPAQVSNMLTKGVDDPMFRNTPEYARAYQLSTEAKVIRTPTGDILHRPELPGIFKPPGVVKSDAQQIKESKAGSKKDVEIIPGTEKELRTSADEKTSVGFYSRMTASEENIKNLGSFDSASYWERLKGLTNITASPELQQYRQAADDWIRAKLRRESGAVIGVEEMQKEYEIYFPQLGDSQAVLEQKKESRKVAIEAMKTASGKMVKKKGKITPDSNYEARKEKLRAAGIIP